MEKKDNKVTIDFNVWQTQSQYAAATEQRLGTISQWVKRIKKNEVIEPKITIWHIEQLGITLVRK